MVAMLGEDRGPVGRWERLCRHACRWLMGVVLFPAQVVAPLRLDLVLIMQSCDAGTLLSCHNPSNHIGPTMAPCPSNPAGASIAQSRDAALRLTFGAQFWSKEVHVVQYRCLIPFGHLI